jgi:N-acetylglucosaminyldiphosphoundecaprenol N-acetyl-beta-D-mannosaminyltransferase
VRERSRSLLGMRVDTPSLAAASGQIMGWANEGGSAYVCAANVHMTMEAFDSASLRHAVNSADLVVPDGKPLAWALGWLGSEAASHIRGVDLTIRVMEDAARDGIPIGLYGGSPETLDRLVDVLRERWPSLRVACAISPPFRAPTAEEDERFVREISASGARVLFVGLGCPKQELWMAAHRGRVPAIMIGVGAAFDFLSGTARQAPPWMQRLGLEWVHRLVKEPRRLWKRYLKHNPRFVALLMLQVSGLRRFA